MRSAQGPGARGPFRDPEARLSDNDIRCVLGALLSEDAGRTDGTILLEEVELWRGRVRADLVLGSATLLHVFEIKSDRDRLHRLENQMHVYNAVADHVTVVVGWELAAATLRQVPSWWEVWLAERAPEQQTTFVPLRPLGRNPAVERTAIAQLLPVEQALEALRVRGADRGLRGRGGRTIRNAASALLSLEELRIEVARWLHRLADVRRGLRVPAASWVHLAD
jgi:hypothetical protein